MFGWRLHSFCLPAAKHTPTHSGLAIIIVLHILDTTVAISCSSHLPGQWRLPHLSGMFWSVTTALAVLIVLHMEAALEQHKGYLSLEHDPWKRAWNLFHSVTGEKAPLDEPASGSWNLSFFDDGMGFLHDGGQGDGVEAEDLLKVTLYKVPASGRHVFHLDEGLVYPDQHAHNHLLLHALVPMGASRHEAKLDIAVFGWPLALCRVQWDLLGIYSAMGLELSKGSRSRWVYKGWHQWQKAFEARHIPALLLRSKLYTTGEAEAETGHGDPGGLRVLKAPTVDTAGLCFLCSVWSSCPKELGGFQNEKDRRAAGDLLEGLLCGVQGQLASIDIFLDLETVFQWPAMPQGKNPISLPVSRSGRVDLRCLKGFIQKLPSRIQKTFSTLALDAAGLEEPLDLFVRRLARAHGMTPLLAQVVWRVACALDCTYGKGADDPDAALPLLPITLKGIGMNLAEANDYQLERHLQAYLQAGQAATAGADIISLATDKSRVHGKGISNTACFLPDNTAFWLPPQACHPTKYNP